LTGGPQPSSLRSPGHSQLQTGSPGRKPDTTPDRSCGQQSSRTRGRPGTQAAYAPGHPADSAKLGRLIEIVEEAAANGRKVVVFSYFRDVPAVVASVLGDLAVGR
jgi:hypothetical protein